MGRIIALGIAGSLGALARYGIEGIASERIGTGFPWGTLVVNATGSFAIGLLFTALIDGRWEMVPWLRTAITVGFLGAYTTFSTFTLESVRLVEEGSYVLAAANVLGNVLTGLFAVVAGAALGRVGS